MSRKLVALSFGDSPDLAELGYDAEHLDVVAMRIARFLLRRGYDIAYGGVFRSQSFLDTLLELVRAETAHQQEEAQAEGRQWSESEPRLFSYQAWPYYDAITTEVIADTLGFIRYVKVHPVDGEGIDHRTRARHFLDPPDGNIPKGAALMAAALTRMRRAMTAPAVDIDGGDVSAPSARIVLGGAVENWAGILPGIAEEILWTARAGQPVYILGAFGGSAKVVADYLRDGENLPKVLTLEHHRSNAKMARVIEGFPAIGFEAVYPEEGFRELQRFLAEACGNFSLLNPLGEENRELMTSHNVINILRILKTQFPDLRGQHSTPS
ncbi:MAG: hypothetical protein AB7S38_14635 [Vulcanimicrobiota bacterium]